MLELNNYYIQELENLTDLFTNIFVIIDDIYNEIIPIGIRNRRNIKDSKLSDSEIITISIVGELLTIDSEKSFFSLLKREYKELFPRLGDRTRFNRTKRNLHLVISKIRGYISEFMQLYSNNIRVIDSMPIPVCEFGRARFSKCFKGEASYGICASKKETYFGFKFHALTTVDGFLTDYVITPANIDDRNAVWDLCDKYRSISIIGDKGYINKRLTPELKTEKDINLLFGEKVNPFITNVLLLLGYEYHKENIKKYKFDDEQIQIQKQRVRECLLNDIVNKHYDGIRISQMLWGTYFINGLLLENGRLQFEPTNNSKIKIHIPEGKKLIIDDVKESLKNSKILLKKYYNIENPQYVCESWLLSKEIADMLDEKSNIIKFQNLFDIKPSKNGIDDILNFVFKLKKCENYDELSENTSLQKCIKEFLKNGGIIYEGYGKLKNEQ